MQKISSETNALNWFEIPAADIYRAKKFYEAILDIQLEEPTEMMGMHMSFFPYNPMSGKVSGGLVQGPMHSPSMDGSVIYLNANPAIQEVIDRVENAGGKILMPKTLINEEIGYMAFIADTEGNRIALHAGN
ncbi:MAG: VOC family protein [Sphingobacteriia bacterium]|nr:VOC family protein [Sphingobacteriia bacterium]